MRLIIVTGMSGAGKSTALKFFEDMGFYCVDNLPILLIEKFAELTLRDENNASDIALGIDIRSGRELPQLQTIINKWRENSYPFEILFLESSDQVLIKRYKETRRSHPLSRSGRVEKGISLEREKLAFLKDEADYVLDTSKLLTKELKKQIRTLFSRDREKSSLFITVLSFGFKYGIPSDADLVFDVRFLPNPYYVEELRFHTGMEEPVRDYLFQYEETAVFLSKLEDLLRFLLPLYEEEGKSSLVIAVGCTGGQHRSVAISHAIVQQIRAIGYPVTESHRDMTRERK